MRHIAPIALLGFALLGPSALAGRTPVPPSRGVAQLIAREDQYTEGALRKNRAALEAVLAPTFIDTSATGQTRDKEQEIAAILGGTRLDSLTVQDRKIQMYGDAAVVTGQFTAAGKQKAKAFTYVGRFTDVWSRQHGVWMCVAAHSSQVIQPGAKRD